MSKRREATKRTFMIETLEKRTQLAADGLGPSILSFSADTFNTGSAQFSMNAVDSSTGAPVSTTWNFGDGSPDYQRNRYSLGDGNQATARRRNRGRFCCRFALWRKRQRLAAVIREDQSSRFARLNGFKPVVSQRCLVPTPDNSLVANGTPNGHFGQFIGLHI
jgi:hypothetical protein